MLSAAYLGAGEKMRITLMISILLLSFVAVADNGLWLKLQYEPNMVVVMRNAESSGNRDGNNMFAWDSSGKCIGESTLTPEGKTQAQRIGEAFARRGIEPLVITSPMCRCRETAQIAFGKFVTDPELRQKPPESDQGFETFQTVAGTMLAEHRGMLPVVFVNHRPNIDALTMELLKIGELLVGVITEDGEIETLGIIQLEQ
ncbi:MAG: histidine phosphatase family protein [Chromatiaceae bacterium]|nr:histidine phosphatase family protein [Chromatiaceae bacterium]